MPSKAADAEEQTLYRTPGGKSTDADIKTNGNVTVAAEFRGLKAEHDLKPKGGGKSCPPCVDEFVALAVEKPDEVQPPEFDRQK